MLFVLVITGLAPTAAADLITDLGVIPTPFSPNGDGVFDSTAVHYVLSAEADVAVSIRDSAGVELDQHFFPAQGSGEHSLWWDGKADGSVVPDGEYVIVVEADPLGGPPEEDEVACVVDTQPPEVVDFEAVPSRFSPDADGVADSLFVFLLLDHVEPSDQIVLSVVDTSGADIASLLSDTGIDSVAIYWDGTADGGGTASDGLYIVALEARDAAGNLTEDGLLVDLDTLPPLLAAYLTDAEAGEIRVADTLALAAGRAYDRAGIVSMEISDDGESWEDLAFSMPESLPAFTARWASTVTCTTCAQTGLDETRTFSVRGRDGSPTAGGQGYVNTETTANPIITFDVVFDVAGPDHVSTVVTDDDAIYLPGETITIESTFDATGYDVTADFGMVDSEFEESAVDVTPLAGGVYRVEYTISLDNTFVPVSVAPVTVTATDGFDRSDSGVVPVSVVEGGAGGEGLVVDANSFDPTSGEDVTISSDAASEGLLVDVFNMAGVLVRMLDAEGGSSVTWDGTNQNGEFVASGVYFLWIRTGDSDTVRKVAVVK
jgi:flagellar hook assembly protein FlgD